jgi:hypothetical protein
MPQASVKKLMQARLCVVILDQYAKGNPRLTEPSDLYPKVKEITGKNYEATMAGCKQAVTDLRAWIEANIGVHRDHRH